MEVAYIDDIVIETDTIEDHVVRIREVFECLREAGFKIRAEKCGFTRTEAKIRWTGSFSRRHKTGPGACEQNRRLDASEEQIGAT